MKLKRQPFKFYSRENQAQFEHKVVPFIGDLGDRFVSISEYASVRDGMTTFVVFYWDEEEGEISEAEYLAEQAIEDMAP